MELEALMPTTDDHCVYCLGAIELPWDAVLVSDSRGTLYWWHLDCRDRSLGLRQERAERVLDA